MNRHVDVKALVSHIVRGDGLDKCRICMGDTSEGQVYLGDTVMMDGERPVTLAELLETITGVEVPIEEDLPAGLCTNCAGRAQEAANFRSLCQQAITEWDSTLQLLNNIPINKDKHTKSLFVVVDKDSIVVVDDIKTSNTTKAAADRLISRLTQVPKEKRVKEVKHKCHCTDCGKKFAYPQHLYLHLKESTDFKRACYVCAQVMTRDALVLHLKHTHNLKTYDCNKCPALVRSHMLLTRHMEEAHSPGACTCGDCGRSFKSRPAYNAHLSVHAVKTCPGCDKVFRNQTCYLYHVKKCCELDSSNKTHKTKNKVTIEVKNKKSDRKTRVGLRGAADKECICDYCGKKLAGKKFITAHIQIVHLKNTHRPCPYCGKFLASAHMGEHLKKHELEIVFTCEYCGIVLKTKLGYVQHIRLHTGEKPYPCQHCGETFSASSRRSEHIRKIHKLKEVVLKYACEFCPARFQLPYKLRNHVSTVHNKDVMSSVPFSCKVCLEKFSSCRGLTHHNRKHQKEGKTDFKVYSHPAVRTESVESVENSSLLPNRICGFCAAAIAPTIHLIEYLHQVNEKWKNAADYIELVDVKDSAKTVYITIDGDAKDFTVYTEKVRHNAKDAVEVLKKFKKRRSLCNATKRRYEMERKLRDSEISTSLKCPECEKSFLCVYKFNIHMRYYDKRACVHCREMINVDEQKEHYAQHGIVPMQCDICFETFRNEETFSKHTVTYHSKGPYFCYICKLSYRDPHHLTSHMTSKHEPRICLGCNKKFSNVYCFRTHTRKCRNAKRKGGIFICDICSKVYSSKYSLKVHLEYIHMNKEHSHQCEHCGKVFNSAVHLLEHSNKHNRVADRFVCNICGMPMSTRRGYQRHYKRHLNPNYVPRKPKAPSDILKAKYKHECDICQERFRLKMDLHAHVATEHPDEIVVEEVNFMFYK